MRTTRSLVCCLFLAHHSRSLLAFTLRQPHVSSSLSRMSLTRSLSKRSVSETSTASVTASVTASSPKALKRSKTASSSDGDELERKESLSNNKAHVRDVVHPLSLTHTLTHTHTAPSTLKIISWNVNGLKALVSTKRETLDRLIATHAPDVLCLQETKIQENIVDQFTDLLPGYEAFFSCSTVKKGYSGTAVFIKTSSISHSSSGKESAPKPAPTTKQKKISSFFAKPAAAEEEKKKAESDTNDSNTAAVSGVSPSLTLQHVYYDFENVEKKLAGEGRTIVLETDKLFIVACYVPNSGEGLVRLNYRVDEWDPFVRDYLHKLSAHKPVIYTGDLNVGHLDLDIHNPTAKHIVKQAGLTPQERESFTQYLADGKFKDAFRFFYPTARGQFTYWSQRTFARPVNKGIRLDYFICSADLFPAIVDSNDDTNKAEEEDCERDSEEAVEAKRVSVDEEELQKRQSPVVVDSYILHADTVGSSDHCPVVLVLKV